MPSFTIFHNTEGTAYSGCDEMLQTIKATNLQEAVAWSKLWCGYDDVTRVTGVGEAWYRESTVGKVDTSALRNQEGPAFVAPNVNAGGPDHSWLIVFIFVYVPIAVAVVGGVWFALWLLGIHVGGG